MFLFFTYTNLITKRIIFLLYKSKPNKIGLFKESTKLTWHMRIFLQFSIFFFSFFKDTDTGYNQEQKKKQIS